MPFGDGTGPRGMGRMSGRGLGPCAGENMPGQGFGRGRGFGRRLGFCPFPVAQASEKNSLEQEKTVIESEIKLLKQELDQVQNLLKKEKKK